MDDLHFCKKRDTFFLNLFNNKKGFFNKKKRGNKKNGNHVFFKKNVA